MEETMYTEQPKKLLIFNILDILRKYTDENHRLSQKEITDILRTEYGMKAERKAIRRNLLDLLDFGYNIEYSESVRMVPNPRTGKPEETYILSDFYLVRDFTDGELRLLIDGLLFSRHIPYSQCKDLVEKLEGLSNTYFRSRIRHISKMPEEYTNNQQIFLNIELLDDAIHKKKKVSFRYLSYGTDKKQHPRLRSDGSDRYLVNPYQMAAKDGKYYLICNLDKYDDVANYRIDRISDIRILEDPVKPFETLRGANGRPLDLAEYMKKHIYMYASGDCRAKLRIRKTFVNEIIDLFGQDVTFSEENDTHVTVSVYANEMAIEQFAKNYAPEVILLEPKEMAGRITESLEKSLQTYREQIGTE